MEDTHFVNCTGLDDEPLCRGASHQRHMTLRSCPGSLSHHPDIKRFTTIWMDTVRNGAFGLANTNKLVRFYEGTTGLKTGYTSSAGHCLSASAQREGLEPVAVVLHCSSSPDRFQSAKALLDYGFRQLCPGAGAGGGGIGSGSVVLGEAGTYSRWRPGRSSQPSIRAPPVCHLDSGTRHFNVEAPVTQGSRLGDADHPGKWPGPGGGPPGGPRGGCPPHLEGSLCQHLAPDLHGRAGDVRTQGPSKWNFGRIPGGKTMK
ncbi:MAG: D-alanyl-D-alanine carboxypeptidase family protein [Oscillospiraceae bacterium]